MLSLAFPGPVSAQAWRTRVVSDVYAQAATAKVLPTNTIIVGQTSVHASRPPVLAETSIDSGDATLAVTAIAENGTSAAGGTLAWSSAGPVRGWVTVELAGALSGVVPQWLAMGVVSVRDRQFSMHAQVDLSVRRAGGTFSYFVSRPDGYEVVCELMAFVVGGTTARVDLSGSLRYTPALTPAQQNEYGRYCGFYLSVTDATTQAAHVVSLHGGNGFDSSPAVFVFGEARAATPIHGTLCTLLVVPLAVVVGRTDALGSARMQISLSPQSGSLVVQALSFDARLQSVRASQGIELKFID